MVIDKLRTVLSTMKADGKVISLLAILKMDEITDRWTIIISGPFEDEAERKDMVNYFYPLLIGTLSDEEKQSLARVGVFPNDMHLVQDLLKYKEGHYTEPIKANGSIIHEAYILESTSENVGSSSESL